MFKKLFKKADVSVEFEMPKKNIEYTVFMYDGRIFRCVAYIEDEKSLAMQIVKIMDIGGWVLFKTLEGKRMIVRADDVDRIAVKGVIEE